MSKNRKLNRKRNYDYSLDGLYFVTIVVKDRIQCFGKIDVKNDNYCSMLNTFGEYAKQCWLDINAHFPHIFVDEFIIMPDHIHGILQIDWDLIKNEQTIGDKINVGDNITVGNNNAVGNNITVGNNNYCSLPGNCYPREKPLQWQSILSKTISSAIRGFKIGVTKFAKNDINIYDFAWQKSFHDRIIRNHDEYIAIKNYIINNPLNWKNDSNKQWK